MTIPNWSLAVALFFEAVFWLGVYVLIIRVGRREKINGMPVIAMMGNISWEFMLGLGSLPGFESLGDQFPACPASWPGCPNGTIGVLALLAAILDLGIAYFIIRYARDHINASDWIKQNFRWLVPLGMGTAFVVLLVSVSDLYIVNPFSTCAGSNNVGCVAGPAEPFLELSHDGGFVTGAVLAIIMGMLFLNLVHERPNLEGQSFFIALFMALGNTAAYVVALLWSGFNLSLLAHVLSVISLTLNFTYVIWYVRVAHDLGINPYAWSK